MARDKSFLSVVANRSAEKVNAGPGQKSLAGPGVGFGPRLAPGRRPMRAHVARGSGLREAGAVKAALVEGWPRLMLAKFSSDEACAEFFGRTRQTGTNWRSGHCKPDAPALALATLAWPGEVFAMLRRVG